ncbi:MAG TPA: transketolase [Spirochaetia bacterium]|nr:transketolase [Spirochaetia bacterium]
MEVLQLRELAHQLRTTVLEMAWRAGSGHIGGSFSCAEILTVLYNRILKHDPKDPEKRDRDIFILSKGHAAPALYFTLAQRGFFSMEVLKTFRQQGSILQGHPDMHKVPGIEISTGSLGMGISNAIGFALGGRLNGTANRVYVLCGDGELDEGECWEALMSAAKFRLDNLTLIIDRNFVQLDGTTEEIMPLSNLGKKIGAFGWRVFTCDGHDIEALLDALEKAAKVKGKPAAIIAETVKGKGVSFMEGDHNWHGKPLTEQEYRAAMEELNGGTRP